ncbi:hypothetical protein ACFL51_01710 [Myxococcota bacterium]
MPLYPCVDSLGGEPGANEVGGIPNDGEPGANLGGGIPVDGLPPVVYERYPGAATAPLPPQPLTYRRRQPERTALYEIVRANLETFLEQPLLEGTEGYPRFIEREFRRYLGCGILSHG